MRSVLPQVLRGCKRLAFSLKASPKVFTLHHKVVFLIGCRV